MAETDAAFPAQAIRDGEAEIEMAKTAQQKSSTPKVKEFAQLTVQNHGEMGKKLFKVAGEHKIDSTGTYGPPQMQPADAETADAQDALDATSGKDFDQAYAAAAVEGHRKAVDLFSDAAKNTQSPDVKTLATESVPVIEQHLQMAQELAKQVDATN